MDVDVETRGWNRPVGEGEGEEEKGHTDDRNTSLYLFSTGNPWPSGNLFDRIVRCAPFDTRHAALRSGRVRRNRRGTARPQALRPLRPAPLRLNNGVHIRRAIRHTPPSRFQPGRDRSFRSFDPRKKGTPRLSLCHRVSLTFSGTRRRARGRLHL